MWVVEVEGRSTAAPERVFGVLMDARRWPEWNPGVAAVRLDGALDPDATPVMVLPDGSELPFRVSRIEQDRVYEDVTEVPDAGVTVTVLHALRPISDGTGITYRCEVDGDPHTAAAVGQAVTSDFPQVIAALAARAEAAGG